MAGDLINNYSQIDTNILEVQLTLDATRIGLHTVSLTNYDNTSESAIAAGSIIEVGGAMYKFTGNETINDNESVSDGTVYVYIVPAGATCTAEYTNDAPTWSDSKQGWYGTGGTANYRYLNYDMEKNSTVWTLKRKAFDYNEINPFKNYVFISAPVITTAYTFTTGQTQWVPINFNAVKDDYTQYVDGGAGATGLITILKDGDYEIETFFSNSLAISTSIFTGDLWVTLDMRVYKNGVSLNTFSDGGTCACFSTSASAFFNAKHHSKRVYTFAKNDTIGIYLYYDAGFTNTVDLGLTYDTKNYVKLELVQ